MSRRKVSSAPSPTAPPKIALQHIPLRSGEAIFVPAGTAHTIGAGLVLCEIQQSSDLTYRVYDYNRRDAHGKPRELHLEKALTLCASANSSAENSIRSRVDRGGLQKTFFAACRYFATENWEFAEPVSAAISPEHFELLIFLEAAADPVRWSNESLHYAPAQVWLVPAGARTQFQFAPESQNHSFAHLRARLISTTSRANWTREGVSEAEFARVVYP